MTKAGPISIWNPTNNEWTKKFLALRRPYLFIYSSPTELDEEAVMSVFALRLDHGERITEMLNVLPPLLLLCLLLTFVSHRTFLQFIRHLIHFWYRLGVWRICAIGSWKLIETSTLKESKGMGLAHLRFNLDYRRYPVVRPALVVGTYSYISYLV